MKHKVFAIVISLALILVMVLPGTLAISIAQDSLTGELTPAVETPVTEETPAGDADPAPVDVPAECTCGAETEVHSETCPLYVAPASHETPMECTCGAENDVHTEPCPLFVAPQADEPACNCTSVDGTHEESCPLYVEEREPVCTCDTQDGIHAEDCPLYAEPQASVYERLLAAKTLDEFQAIIEAASEEELSSFTCEEFDNVDAHYIYLSTGEYPDYSPVVDEVMEIVNFTNVAPFVGTGE